MSDAAAPLYHTPPPLRPMTRTFQIAFKPPGMVAHVFRPEVPKQEIDIDAWMSSVLMSQGWTGWFCYNDDPPNPKGKPAQAYFGHCKGVVLWNDAVVGWLIHSVPRWPIEMPNEGFPAADVPYGHSLAFWMGPRDRLEKIETQVDLMGAKVYAGKRSSIHAVLTVATLQRINLDAHTDHLAKNRTWGRDMYESLGRCLVRSRASLEDTSAVHNVISLDLPGWDPELDRSIWAVGEHWVCVGDVRRGSTEFSFGGGGIIHYDQNLARTLRELVVHPGL